MKRKVSPKALSGLESTADLLRGSFPAFAGRNMREAFRLMKKSIEENYTVFLTLSGAMTPAGLHHSCLIPMLERGMVHAVTTTGANLYHDFHRSLGFQVHELDPHGSDLEYRQDQTVRIYDLGITSEILCETDKFIGRCLKQDAFQRSMTTPEFHHELGRVLAEYEEAHDVEPPSLLATCFRRGVPIFCGAPQDGSLFLEAVQLSLLDESFAFRIDIMRDVVQMAALQYLAQSEGNTAVWIIGGGVPKNFTLQGEPTLSQVLGIKARGFDLDLQICVDVEDNGALSSCTAGEGHTWGKTSAECAEVDSVYLRSDATIALPVLTHALLGECGGHRPSRCLMDRLSEAETFVKKEFKRVFEGPNPPLYSGY